MNDLTKINAVPCCEARRCGATAMANPQEQARLASLHETLSTLPDYVG